LDGEVDGMDVRYRLLNLRVDLNDPEGKLQLRVADGEAILEFVDWRARKRRFRFPEVVRSVLFLCFGLSGLAGRRGGGFTILRGERPHRAGRQRLAFVAK